MRNQKTAAATEARIEIMWQIEMDAWRTLGLPSWSAMREQEYGGAAVMVPSKSRPEIVARIKEIEVGRTTRGGTKHLTNQEIAETVGASEPQIRRDLRPSKSDHLNVSADPDDDIIDAEIVEDGDTPNEVTDPAPAESVNTIACPTCHGT